MSLEAITWAYSIDAPSSSCKAVLLVLANYADERDSAYPGVARIAKMTQLSERTVQRAISDMEECGMLRSVAQFDPKSGEQTTNRYYLDMRHRGVMVSPGVVSQGHRGGDTVTPNTKKTPSRGHETTVPAERVKVERSARPKRRGKQQTDDGEGAERTGSLPDDQPQAEVTSIRKPTIGGLAKAFEREARTHYKLGDPRRITNMVALRDNMARWRDNGIALEDIALAIDAFWAAGMVREGQEPWKRFITTITVTLSKATAPDITNPDYYTTPQEEHEMDAAEKWLKENGL